MAKNKQIAENVLSAVGGKENVVTAMHCMTRLRLVLRDESNVDEERLSKVEGVIKVVHAGGQVQVVIGTNVDKVYDEFCKIGNFDRKETIPENKDSEKKKLTLKGLLNSMMGAVSGSLTPILPVLIAGGMFKMVAVLLGPDQFGILSEDNQIYIFCTLVNTAVYYFLPFFVAFTAAKKFHGNPIYPMMLAAVMVHPEMLEIVAGAKPFNIYGLFPMQLVNYTNGVIPIIINAWVLSQIEQRVRKIVPDQLRVIGVPVIIMAIGFPLGFCIFGPICNLIMEGIANLIIWTNNNIGIAAILLVAALWSFVVMFGMHIPVMMTLLPTWIEMGFDAIVSPATIAGACAGIGVQLAYALRAGSKDKRALGWSCLTTNVIGNISEPALYGILLVDKKALAYSMLGAMTGAVAMFIMGAKVTLFSGVGFPFLNFLRFGEYAIPGAIGMIIAFGASLALGMVFGFERVEEEVPSEELAYS